MPKQQKIILWTTGIAVVGVILFSLSGALWREYHKAQMSDYLRRFYNHIPTPDQTTLIHQRYYGCSKCLYTGMFALYATDLYPAQVRSFYQNYIQNSQWVLDGQWEGRDINDHPVQWSLDADWKFDEDSLKRQSFGFSAQESKDTLEFWYSPPDMTRKAITSGQTVYLIQIFYVQDRTVFEQMCPPFLVNACENDSWEIDLR